MICSILDATNEVLLVQQHEIVSQLENIRNMLGKADTNNANHTTVPTMERSSADNVYVNVYNAPHYYWEKCFPNLYPYGRGGPSDPLFSLKRLSEYHKHILRRGGGRDGRRFQNCASHVFATYTYEIRR